MIITTFAAICGRCAQEMVIRDARTQGEAIREATAAGWSFCLGTACPTCHTPEEMAS